MNTRLSALLGAVAAALLVVAPVCAATNVAVFNFQMKSDTRDWKWLEKGLSDRIATDFTQDRGLTVVARDEMQLVAQKMNWVPEMATADPQRMKELQSQLKIEYLATGVYSVSGDEIAIIGQIVEVKGRAELFRKEVKGKAADVLELQRRLSADLLSWFSKKPPAEILPMLPVWTRSLPAAKALYEGMDLYDQGRYAEGWLKFRQASKADAAYMEAQYWVGKMYYFMNRYEHARRAIERFVYLDTVHPRVGDAMVEYVHTVEAAGAPPEALLRLYADFSARFPLATIREGGMWGRGGWMESAAWFQCKTAQLLEQTGQLRRAAEMSRPAMIDTEGLSARPSFCMQSVLKHHAMTGDAFEPRILMPTEWPRVRNAVLQFDPSGAPLTTSLIEPRRVLGSQLKNIDRQAIFDGEGVRVPLFLVAPSRHVFTGLKVYPLTDGDAALLDVGVFLPGTYAGEVCFAEPRTEPLASARRDGVACNDLPRTGMLLVYCQVRVRDSSSGPVTVRGFKVAPALTRLPAVGAIDVSCPDTPIFRVEVDGVFARWFPGLIGPLSPGSHTVRLMPVLGGTPYGESQTTVTVQAGTVVPLAGRLPWAKESPWAGWTTTLVGQRYAEHDLRLNKQPCPPAVQVDDEAIRLVWTRGGDLWSSVSTDGRTFSLPAKLDLPVSTAWLEYGPQLLRDESGRMILVFRSDRDGQHRHLPYLTWSRDFVHWSKPILIQDEGASRYAIQEHNGRLLLAWNAREGIRIRASSDACRWEDLSTVPCRRLPWDLTSLQMIRREDGRLELIMMESYADPPNAYEEQKVAHRIVRRQSGDGRQWSSPETLAEFSHAEFPYRGGPGGLACTHLSGRTWVWLYRGDGPRMEWATRLLAETADGGWEKSAWFWGMPAGYMVADAHARWGYLIASLMPDGDEMFPHPAYGPFLWSGPSLDPILRAQPIERPSRPQLASLTGKQGGQRLTDASGGTIYVATPPPSAEGPKPEAKPRLPPNVLSNSLVRGAATAGGLRFQGLSAEGTGGFVKPRPNAGTVNPRALVATIRREPLTLAVAIDSNEPGSAHYDVLRLDASGRGDFRDAAVVPRTGLVNEGNNTFSYQYENSSTEIKWADHVIPVSVTAVFTDAPSRPSLSIRLGGYGQALCRFGQKDYPVRIFDGNSNLRLGDKTGLAVAAGGQEGMGDSLFVDIGDGSFNHTAAAFAGHPVLVDGVWYDVEVSADGTKLVAKPLAGATASVRVGHPAWEGWFMGANSVFILHGGLEPVLIPPGRYRLLRYRERLPADWKNPQDCLVLGELRSGVAAEPPITATAGQTVEVRVGSPIRAAVSVSQSGDAVRFEIQPTDAIGRSDLEVYNARSVLHRMTGVMVISDAAGNRLGTVKVTASSVCYVAEWKVPAGKKGRFTAALDFSMGPFPCQTENITFEVK